MQRRGLLLDRDGVINIDHGYVGHPEKFEFIPAVFPFLRAAQDLGYRLAILTNQAGVGRGYFTPADFENLCGWINQEMARQGITIDLTLAAFEHPEGVVPTHTRESFWRKPNPGMVLEAVQRLNLDRARSFFLGDHLRDMQAGAAAGIGGCLYLTEDGKDAPDGVKVVKDYNEALKVLRQVQ